MLSERNLDKAKKLKDDEFYTCYEDVKAELRHYKEHFKDKIVYCNCDDVNSAFWSYFYLNFKLLGLKRLIISHNGARNIIDGKPRPYKVEVFLKDGRIEWEVAALKGNGDFRSNECIELLEKADIICTNPPFSLFREYISQLVEYQKKFLVLGNMNAITYKEVFPLIMNNDLWYGVSIKNGDRKFYVPKYYSLRASGGGIDGNGRKFIRIKGVRWFTNIDNLNKNQFIDLASKYSSEKYFKYDNYEAINVDKTLDIPADYDGIMGVPVSFMDKYCSEQFEIVGKANNPRCNGRYIYKRILIRRKKQSSK